MHIVSVMGGAAMLVTTRRGNVLTSSFEHIAFMHNTEAEPSGFSEPLADFWPELTTDRELYLGEVLSTTHGGRTWYALICCSNRRGGYRQTPFVITDCLSKIPVEAVALTLSGLPKRAGLKKEVLAGVAVSTKKVTVFLP